MVKKSKVEKDSAYLLKILLYFIVGAIWVKTKEPLVLGLSGLPVGLIIGFMFAWHDHFMIDRKIEYVVLLAAALFSYIAPVGIVIQL